MLDERPIIASWKARIADFIMKYPEKKDSLEVVRLQEHIHELELAAKSAWIPCSERLPDEKQEVIVTFENNAGIWVDKAIFFKNEFYYVTDAENGYYEEKYTNVIAWMLLPEPYKGVD